MTTCETNTRPRREPRPLPTIEEVMKQPYWDVRDMAVVLRTTPDGIRTMMDLASIPEPAGKRGRRWFWVAVNVIDWMEATGTGEWTPPPWRGPKPPKVA